MCTTGECWCKMKVVTKVISQKDKRNTKVVCKNCNESIIYKVTNHSPLAPEDDTKLQVFISNNKKQKNT